MATRNKTLFSELGERFGMKVHAGWQEAARYVHLNPVRVAGLSLHKSARAASRAGTVGRPSAELLAERWRILREFRWSSYPGYAGYRPPLAWICCEPLARLCGGKSQPARRTALRAYAQAPVLQGAIESPRGRLLEGMVLGSAFFAQKLHLTRAASSTCERRKAISCYRLNSLSPRNQPRYNASANTSAMCLGRRGARWLIW